MIRGWRRRSRPDVTLVASDAVPWVAGGVRLRWQGLSAALGRVARLHHFAVPSPRFGGGAGGDDDPFAAHYHPEVFADLVDHIRATRARVVVLTNVQLHRYVRQLGEREICPVVYDMHNAEHPLWRDIRASAPARWRDTFYSETQCAGVRRAESAAVAAADQVWVCSAADGRRVAESYGAGHTPKVRVVPNAVGRPPARIRHRGPPRHVVYTGRFDYYPNVDALERLVTEIAPRLASTRPDLPIVLAGAGLPTALDGASPNVRLVADPPDVTALVAAGVMTVPLALGGGTRFKILEALSLRAPVVSTRKGAEGLDLDDRTHYLRAETPDEFVAAILELADDPGLRRSLADAGTALVAQDYSTSTLATKVNASLDELCPTGCPGQ